MQYTVISIFPHTADTEKIKTELRMNGFRSSDIIISVPEMVENSSADNYEEDEKTRNFWDFLFVKRGELLESFSKESVGKTDVVVYTDSWEDALKAKKILNSLGAIEVSKKKPEIQEDTTAGLSEDVYNGIIAKARHGVYFLDAQRVYRPKKKGMRYRMDALGNKK